MTVQTGGRQVLVHGLALILAGLLWGMCVPLTPYPRLALGAHIQFNVNGMLLILLSLVLTKVPNRSGAGTAGAMVFTAWMTWPMALSEVANAWWGTRQVLPIAAEQAGASGGATWQELIVTACHIPGSIGLILTVGLLLSGVLRQVDPG
ncbi:MAG: hypothetical protein AMXMBFR84_36870 [Candidatus Hydrogenedentota bacterium]